MSKMLIKETNFFLDEKFKKNEEITCSKAME